MHDPPPPPLQTHPPVQTGMIKPSAWACAVAMAASRAHEPPSRVRRRLCAFRSKAHHMRVGHRLLVSVTIIASPEAHALAHYTTIYTLTDAEMQRRRDAAYPPQIQWHATLPSQPQVFDVQHRATRSHTHISTMSGRRTRRQAKRAARQAYLVGAQPVWGVGVRPRETRVHEVLLEGAPLQVQVIVTSLQPTRGCVDEREDGVVVSVAALALRNRNSKSGGCRAHVRCRNRPSSCGVAGNLPRSDKKANVCDSEHRGKRAGSRITVHLILTCVASETNCNHPTVQSHPGTTSEHTWCTQQRPPSLPHQGQSLSVDKPVHATILQLHIHQVPKHIPSITTCTPDLKRHEPCLRQLQQGS